MKIAHALILSTLTLLSIASQAEEKNLERIAAEVARIKSIIPAGKELAGAYFTTVKDFSSKENKIFTKSGDEYLKAVAKSYVFADFNNDGRQDLAVVVENAPKVATGHFGDRTLIIYVTDSSGQLQEFAKGGDMLMAAGEGDSWEDPYKGITLTPAGEVVVTHQDTLADKPWTDIQTYAYRSDTFYDVMKVNITYYPKLATTYKNVYNYLTGEAELTTTKDGQAPVVEKSKGKPTPLNSLQDDD